MINKKAVLFPVLLLAACQQDSSEAFEESWEGIEETEKEPVNEVREAVSEDWEDGVFLDKTLDYESEFAANDYTGDTSADELYRFEEGEEDMRVLITAPHATSYIRDSDQETQPAAIYTGALAQLLQDYTGAHILYTLKQDADPSFYPGSPFKQEIENIAEERDIDVVIDLLGAAASHNFALDIGTDEGSYIDDRHPAELKAYAEIQDVGPIAYNHTFPASEDQTIAGFSRRELGLDAMQLQIHSSFRNPREKEEAFYDMTVVLSEFIYDLDQSYNNE